MMKRLVITMFLLLGSQVWPAHCGSITQTQKRIACFESLKTNGKSVSVNSPDSNQKLRRVEITSTKQKAITEHELSHKQLANANSNLQKTQATSKAVSYTDKGKPKQPQSAGDSLNSHSVNQKAKQSYQDLPSPFLGDSEGSNLPSVGSQTTASAQQLKQTQPQKISESKQPSKRNKIVSTTPEQSKVLEVAGSSIQRQTVSKWLQNGAVLGSQVSGLVKR